jgi:hypothetical protein
MRERKKRLRSTTRVGPLLLLGLSLAGSARAEDGGLAGSGSVTLAASQLPVGVVGQGYVGMLRAAGGSGRYEWTLIDDLQLPDSTGSTAKDLRNVEPPGFTRITPDGSLIGQPTQAGLFALSVRATEVLPDRKPGASTTDTILLRIVPEGLYIKDSILPEATIGVPYHVNLETDAVSVGSVYFQSVDSSGQDTPAARASVPNGLSLGQDGTLSGTPQARGRYSFLVQAIDQSQNRSAIGRLSLDVVDPAPSSGCATGGFTATGAPTVFALLSLTALWRYRRLRATRR